MLADPKQFRRFLRQLHRQDWVVYAKPAFGGPTKVLRYLGRYTHRIAISNHRLLAFDGERVTFRWKDYAHGGKQRTMTLLRNGVLAPFLPARAAEGLRQNPVLWFPREPIPHALPPALPATAGERSPRTRLQILRRLPPTGTVPICGAAMIVHPQAHRCGTVPVHLLRLLLSRGQRRATDVPPARPRVRVSCPPQNHFQAAFLQPASKQLLRHRHSLRRSYPDIRGSSGSLSPAAAVQKRHSIAHRPRPPQTPAPSF